MSGQQKTKKAVARENVLECISVRQRILFKIGSAGKRIWLIDQKDKSTIEIHLAPDQAVKVGETLVELGRNIGKDLLCFI